MDVIDLLNDSASETPESSSDSAPTGVVPSLPAGERVRTPPARPSYLNDTSTSISLAPLTPSHSGLAQLAASPAKRSAEPHPEEPPDEKRQPKWSREEDALITELRGNGMKWEDIAKHLPGRSTISCRLRFQNYLERRLKWDEEKMNKLARLYER